MTAAGIITIIIIIIIICEFFTPPLADGLLLESVCQQISPGLSLVFRTNLV